MTIAPGVLGEIVERTRARVAEGRRNFPLDRMMARAPTRDRARPFAEALKRPNAINVIGEFKRRSPSRGLLCGHLHPANVARAYEMAGAAAVSILTEPDFFGGSIDDLRQARFVVRLPVLRKDFIVDRYQIEEAWIAGADAVLLIAAALPDRELATLLAATTEVGLAALVEVHDREELERAVGAGARIVGVNNRDLRTLAVSIETSFELRPHLPSGVIAVAESGIVRGVDLKRLRDAGFDAFLVGEHLMTAVDPGAALADLIREAEAR